MNAKINKMNAKKCSLSSTAIQVTDSDLESKELYLPLVLSGKEATLFGEAVQGHHILHHGELLYEAGEAFTSLYIVRSGSIKTFIHDDEGIEYVTGFYLPGDMLGFDGINSLTHGCSVMGLETSALLEIPFLKFEALSRTMPTLQTQLSQLMSKEIQRNHLIMHTLAKKNAEARIAIFLLNLSRRYSQRNYSSSAMHLSMSRIDIGNFLGLTIETVSRIFSRMQKNGVIKVDGREIVILSHATLLELSRTKR